MEVTTIIMSKSGIIETVRNIIDADKANKVFGEMVKENDSFATDEDVEIGLENCYHDNNSGLSITILETMIEGEI